VLLLLKCGFGILQRPYIYVEELINRITIKLRSSSTR